MLVNVWVFLGISAIVIVVPGPDTALVTKNAVVHGRSAALGTAVGVVTGLSVWTVASALGVASLVRASQTTFITLKLIGAAYLVGLGLQAFRAARRAGISEADAAPPGRDLGPSGGWRQGVLSNLANPKIAAFFTGVLPQFAGSNQSVLIPFLLLGLAFVLMTLVWLSGYALVAARASAVLRRPRVKATIDRLSGVILIGFGLRLATEHR